MRFTFNPTPGVVPQRYGNATADGVVTERLKQNTMAQKQWNIMLVNEKIKRYVRHAISMLTDAAFFGSVYWTDGLDDQQVGDGFVLSI